MCTSNEHLRGVFTSLGWQLQVLVVMVVCLRRLIKQRCQDQEQVWCTAPTPMRGLGNRGQLAETLQLLTTLRV